MRNKDYFKVISDYCKKIAPGLENNKELRKEISMDWSVDPELEENEMLVDLILECNSEDYFHYHQDGRIDPSVPFLVDNFDDIKALINDSLNIDEKEIDKESYLKEIDNIDDGFEMGM